MTDEWESPQDSGWDDTIEEAFDPDSFDTADDCSDDLSDLMTESADVTDAPLDDNLFSDLSDPDISIPQEDNSVAALEAFMTANAETEEVETADTTLDDVEPYHATPNADIPILQEDGSIASLEEIMAANAETEALTELEPEEPETAEPLSDLADTAPETEETDDVSSWLGEINPNFDPYDVDSPYCNNCGSCAYAVAQRLDGDSEIAATDENIGTVEEMNALTGMEQVSMSPEEIQEYLISQGPGSHGIVGVDRVSGPGHWFNAYYDGEKVVAIDGQTGQVSDWPPDYGEVTNWDISVRKEGSS